MSRARFHRRHRRRRRRRRRRFVSLSVSLTNERDDTAQRLHLTWIFEGSCETRVRERRRRGEKMKIRKAYERSLQRRDDELCCAHARTSTRRYRGGPRARVFFPRVTPLVAIRIVCLSSRYLFTRLLLQDRSNNQSLCVRRNLRRSHMHHAGFILIRLGNGSRVERCPAAPKILNIHN